MACRLLKMDYNTGFAVFTIDKESDLDNLPKIGVAGKEGVSEIKSACEGSKAISTDGGRYVLVGDSNTWSKVSSGGGGGEDWEEMTTADVDELFK